MAEWAQHWLLASQCSYQPSLNFPLPSFTAL